MPKTISHNGTGMTANETPSVSADALMPIVYDQLRDIAASYLRQDCPDQMLEPASLVNETYLRLARCRPGSWRNTEHFLAIAAKAMRKVLIDHARRRRALKRGFGQARISLELCTSSGSTDVEIGDLDEVLHRLASTHRRAANVVELRFFGGLTHQQTARVLGVSRKTVTKDWAFAREYLAYQLDDTSSSHRSLDTHVTRKSA